MGDGDSSDGGSGDGEGDGDGDGTGNGDANDDDDDDDDGDGGNGMYANNTSLTLAADPPFTLRSLSNTGRRIGPVYVSLIRL